MARAAKPFVFLFIFLHLSSSLFDSYVLALEGEGIIGGKYATENQFKYVVSIQKHGRYHICGGGIIGDQFILTAAHCVIDEKGEFFNTSYRVVADSVDLGNIYNKVMSIGVVKAYVSRDYEPLKSGVNDIAVLKLEEPLGLSNNTELSKLELPLSDMVENYEGKTAVVAGYGCNLVQMKFFNMIQHDCHSDLKLKYANVTILDKQECRAPFWGLLKYLFKSINNDQQICGQLFQHDPNNPEGLCLGDSGSPLVIDNTVIGVMNSSPKDCLEQKMGAVYTRVSSFLPFIEQAIEGNHSEQIRAFTLPE